MKNRTLSLRSALAVAVMATAALLLAAPHPALAQAGTNVSISNTVYGVTNFALGTTPVNTVIEPYSGTTLATLLDAGFDALATTNPIPAGATNAARAVMNLSDFEDVAIDWQSALTNGETAHVTLTFDESLDGVAWQTGVTNWVYSSSGTNLVYGVLLLSRTTVGPVPYWRLGTVVNAATNSPAAVLVRFLTKQYRYGLSSLP